MINREQFEKSKNKDIIFGSNGRVRIWFDPKSYGFFSFGLFRIRVEKIVFRTQNFRVGSGRIF